MGCPDANDVGAFVEGLLSNGDAAAVESHLDRCDDCRRLLAALASDLSVTSSTDPSGRIPAELDSVSGLPPAPESTPTRWNASEA